MKEEEREQTIRRIFRHVFSGEDGTIALAYILDDLSFFTVPTTPEEIARRSYATELLHDRLGVTDIIAITKALMITGKE